MTQEEKPPQTPSEGADPEDKTSGGSGTMGTETHGESAEFDRGGEGDPGVGDEDIQTDREGEPVTKPDGD